jgi:hypothetical protein
VPRAHKSHAVASYLRGPKRSSGARYGLRKQRLTNDSKLFKVDNVPTAYFEVHLPFRLRPNVPWASCGRVCNAKVYEHGRARSVKEYIPRFYIAVRDSSFRSVQIRDARKDLIYDGLGNYRKRQDTPIVMRLVWIWSWRKGRNTEKVGKRKGHEGHPKPL